MLSKTYNKKVLFTVHPRTRKMLNYNNINLSDKDNIKILNPLGYLEFIGLMKQSLVIITDSGGIQEETTYLKIPCLTLRENTERPITIEIGTNQLIGMDMNLLKSKVDEILNGRTIQGNIPPLWDGKTSSRIVEVIQEYFL